MTDPYADTLIPTFNRAPFFELLSPEKSPDKTWRWQLKAGNGELLATSEPFGSRTGCLDSISKVKASAAVAEIR